MQEKHSEKLKLWKYKTERRIKMNLTDFSTKELVEELSKREAVEKIIVEPYEKYSITVGEQKINDKGPVVILRIWD